MKHFIVDLDYRIPAEQIGDVLTEHRAFLKKGYDQGRLLCSGPKVPKTGGVIIAKAPSLAALQEFFQDDPYVVKGIAEYRYIEFDTVLRQAWLDGWVLT